MHTATPTTAPALGSRAQFGRLGIVAITLLLGLTLLGGIGFAGSGTLHRAAHDVRHAAGFPCH